MSVAAVQEHLRASGYGNLIQMRPYLSELCKSLAGSMIGDSRSGALQVLIGGEPRLIMTELVLNALKHAFPAGRGGRITVTYEVDGTD